MISSAMRMSKGESRGSVALTRGFVLAPLLLVLAGPPAGAQAPPRREEGWSFSAHGRLRYRHIGLSDFPLDGDGTMHGQLNRGTMLLRVNPRLAYDGRYAIQLGLQALDGQIYGDESTVGGDAPLYPRVREPIVDQLMLREAYLDAWVGIGSVQVGRMVSRWGLELLANDGGMILEGHPERRDDPFEYPFADTSNGDVVNRFIFHTDPWVFADEHGFLGALVFALGADVVARDELIDGRNGDCFSRWAGDSADCAWQVVGAAFWQGAALQAGAYVAYRDLERKEGYRTRATAVDLYGRWQRKLGESWRLTLSGEAVLVAGSTEEVDFERARAPVDVLQYGGVLRGLLQQPESGLDIGLEAGLASGDNDPQDDTLSALRFDPGYKVGMILFEEVLARSSARSYDRVRDPELSGEPPRGAERTLTDGSVTNAVYLYPHVVYDLVPGYLDARLGSLLAFSHGDVSDAYAGAEYGGYNRNAWGKNQAHGLMGWELNAGTVFRLERVWELVDLYVGAQYGLFLPGPALGSGPDDAELGAVHKWRLMADIRW